MNFTTIVLGHKDHKERDRLYTLLTREMGKIVVRGSGARRSGAKLAPHLESLMISHVAVAKNRGRGTLTFALCEESMLAVRDNAAAFTQVRGVLSVTASLLKEEDPHPQVYDLLMVYLHTMERLVMHGVDDATLCVVTQGYYFHLLARLGWHTQTARCVRCDQSLAQNAIYTYVLGEGGFLCAACAATAQVPQQHTVQLSRDAAAALRVFGDNALPSLAKLNVPHTVCDELALLSKRRIAWIS